MARRLNHETPLWVDSEAIYFITLTAQQRGKNQFCHPGLGKIILDSIAWREANFIWHCPVAVLMPDHFHLLLRFPSNQIFTKVVRDWKNWLARARDVDWQRGYFDHRLRHEESLEEKADYILQNPVRAGLVEKAEDWPYTWISQG